MLKLPARVIRESLHFTLSSSDDVLDVVCENNRVKMFEIAVSLDEAFLLIPSMGRAVSVVLFEVAMPAADTVIVIDTTPAEMPGVVGPQRVVPMTAVVVERGIDPAVFVPSVPVSEIVVAVLRTNEHMQAQPRQVNDTVRSIEIAGPCVHGASEIDGCEAHSPIHQSVVPVAGNVDTTVRCPVMVRWYPNPVVVAGCPIPRLPEIAISAIFPAAAYPEIIGGGSRARRTVFKACRWLRQILNLLGLEWSPEAGDPLVAACGGLPIARHPSPIRGTNPVDSGYPEEVLAFIVPGPIPRNPNRVFRRFYFRRHFRNGLWGSLWHYKPWLWIEVDRLGKRFVDRASQQVFRVAFVGRRWWW